MSSVLITYEIIDPRFKEFIGDLKRLVLFVVYDWLTLTQVTRLETLQFDPERLDGEVHTRDAARYKPKQKKKEFYLTMHSTHGVRHRI